MACHEVYTGAVGSFRPFDGEVFVDHEDVVYVRLQSQLNVQRKYSRRNKSSHLVDRP